MPLTTRLLWVAAATMTEGRLGAPLSCGRAAHPRERRSRVRCLRFLYGRLPWRLPQSPALFSPVWVPSAPPAKL